VSYPRPAPRVPADPIFYSSLLIDAPTNDRNYVINLSTQHNNKQLITAVTTGCHSNESKGSMAAGTYQIKLSILTTYQILHVLYNGLGDPPKSPFPRGGSEPQLFFFK